MEQIADLFPISEKRQRELFMMAQKEVKPEDIELAKAAISRWREVAENLKDLELAETVHFTLYLIEAIKNLKDGTDGT